MILVSACLAGFNCRYDGNNKENNKIIQLIKDGKAIPIYPEQLAGLTTPRKSVEDSVNNKVLAEDGEDFTERFLKGTYANLELCKKYNITKAILKDHSPSFGSKKIYDGNFNGTLINGRGVTAKLLKENGIEVKRKMISKNISNRQHSKYTTILTKSAKFPMYKLIATFIAT